MINLSQKQSDIVNFGTGALLVKASAGSGKTRVLTERIKKLLSSTKRKVLAITFTNKAGEEMEERLRGAEGVSDRLFVGTFHGFCQQVLESHGKQIGLAKMPHIFEDQSDRLKLVEQALLSSPYYQPQYAQKTRKEQVSYLYKVLEFISEVKRSLLNDDELLSAMDNDEDLVLLYKEYQDILRSQNAIDFDDLILLAYRLFSSQPNITALYRRTYEFICIDEAQDLNNAQYHLLKAITAGEHDNIMMVGDPNQSIFAFNGSSSDFMTKDFVKDYGAQVIELKENYRSAKAVLAAADKLMPNSNDIVNTIKEGEFRIVAAADESNEADLIYRKIEKLLEIQHHPDIEGDITADRIAVLARNKYVFASLEKLFLAKGVPFYFKVTPGSIKYESELMKMFDLGLKVKVNPEDALHFSSLKTALKIPDALNLQDVVSSRIAPKFQKVFQYILSLNEDGGNFKKSINDLSVYFETTDIINDDNERNMALKDLQELQLHWLNYAKKTDRKSLSNFKNSMALGQTHPLAQSNGVTLSTVHTMKGQEYDIVFIMGMDDETFPDYRAIKSGGVEMTQEKNNLYVAITRAKRFLYITWPSERLMPWGDVKTRRRSRLLEGF